ncbi:MAG: hypothetical protein ACJ79F_10700, partial [Gemmatimonadaceae bacterium]
ILARYDDALSAEADQIDLVVAGAYEAMAHFELFAAQAMLYFATVSFAEVTQRLKPKADAAWTGFLGVGDSVFGSLPYESVARLHAITRNNGDIGTPAERQIFSAWVEQAIGSRNIAGLAEPAKRNLYPVDFDALIARHDLLGMTREEILAALPSLRGMSPRPKLPDRPFDPAADLAERRVHEPLFTAARVDNA